MQKLHQTELTKEDQSSVLLVDNVQEVVHHLSSHFYQDDQYHDCDHGHHDCVNVHVHDDHENVHGEHPNVRDGHENEDGHVSVHDESDHECHDYALVTLVHPQH